MFDGAREVSRLCLTVLLMIAAGGLLAQSYPTRPIRLVVGYPPGGPYDPISRTVSQKMAETLGQTIVVDFRGGAAGSIGADTVAKSTPDGYTLLFMGSAFAIAPSVTSRLPFDPVKDFTPVGQVGAGYDALIVNPALPVKSVKELVALAKKSPGKLTFASSGTGGPLHLHGELFKIMAGISMLHIPYKGAGPAVTDVVGGRRSDVHRHHRRSASHQERQGACAGRFLARTAGRLGGCAHDGCEGPISVSDSARRIRVVA